MKKELSILILGAGVYQVPAIKKAKKLGYKTICLSYNIKKYPGYNLADISLECDTTNIEKVLDIAKKYKINGVFTTGTDVALKALGKVNDEMNLIGPSFKSCLLSTNKSLMKKIFIEQNVPTAKYFEANSYKEAVRIVEKLEFPLIVKAINTSGGRGIKKIEDINELVCAWKFAKQYSKKNDSIIIEEFLEGIEFGAQVFVFNGKIKLTTPHNDTVTQPPYKTPFGHSYPLVNKVSAKELMNVVRNAVKALEINNSAANFDLIQTKNGIKVFEVGARMGATCLPMLTEIFTGVDVTSECLKMSMGLKPNFDKKNKQACAGLLLRSNKTGIIKNVKIDSELKEDKKIVYYSLDYNLGDKVNKFLLGPDRIGEIIVLGETSKLAEKYAENYAKKIKFMII